MQFIIFLSIIQGLLWLGHYFIYKTVIKFTPLLSLVPLAWARGIFFVLSVSFLAASLVAFRFYGPLARFFYQASAVWLGTLYFLIIACVLVWLIYLFSGFRISVAHLAVISSALMIAALLVSAYGVWNSYQTRVQILTITLPNLPEQWKGRKAVLLADTHLGPFRNVSFSRKVANLVSAQHPDLVLIPGDFYDGEPTDYQGVAEAFGKISATFGVYFASGNHEEFRSQGPFFKGLSDAGVHVLQNEKTEVDGLQLIGVDFASSRRAEGAAKLYQLMKIDKTRASILIKHEPNNISEAEAAGISLQASGHTHNGQNWPLGLLAKRLYGKFYLGHQFYGNLQTFTTSGVGTWGPPQRVGTFPEIVVITLQSP